MYYCDVGNVHDDKRRDDVYYVQYVLQTGEPQASIQWLKDGQELYPGDKYDMQLSNGVAKLNIRATELLDDGEYRVVAKNKVGEFSSDAQLTVYS